MNTKLVTTWTLANENPLANGREQNSTNNFYELYLKSEVDIFLNGQKKGS